MSYTLYHHQVSALAMAQRQNVALYHDCGCGKTLSAICIIRFWKNQGVGPALVVCPKSIMYAAWAEDLNKFSPDLRYVVVADKNPKKRLAKLDKKADIYILNYDQYKILFRHIVKKGFGVMIVDESSKMKSHNSQITMSLLAMAGVNVWGAQKKGFWPKGSKKPYCIIPHRYVLSGTPAPNGHYEYWSQTKFVAGSGRYPFCDQFYRFRNTWFVDKYSRAKNTLAQEWYLPDRHKDEFMRLMSPWCHVVKKEDAVDLPEQVHEIRDVELNGDETVAYLSMKRELVIEFADCTVIATNVLSEIMKLRQLTSGFCYVGHGSDRRVERTGKSKLNALLELLEEIGHKPVIIWCNFIEEMEQVDKALGDKCVTIWTGDDNEIRDSKFTQFRSDERQYLVCNPQSCGHGLTFVNCSDAVYFSQNYSYELQKQSEDRIHRIGQRKKCTYYHLIASNTIDADIRSAVRDKRKISEAVLDFLRRSKK